MQGQMTTMQGQITGLQAEMVRVNARLSSLEDRMSSLEDRMSAVEDGQARMRTEMNERFISLEDQFRTLSLKTELFETRIESTLAVLSGELVAVKDQGWQLNARMKNIEVGIGDLNGRVDHLGDEMRQRFRLVNERLAAVA